MEESPRRGAVRGRRRAAPPSRAVAVLLLAATAVAADADAPGRADSGPLVIHGQSTFTLRDARVSNPGGPCVIVRGSTGVHLENLEVGPCGGNGIDVQGSRQVTIANSRISTRRSGHARRDSGLGVHVRDSTHVLVQGNQFTTNESGVLAVNSRDVRVVGNYLAHPLGPYPRGQHVQFARVEAGEIAHNYGVVQGGVPEAPAADQEDAVNIFRSSAVRVLRNYLVGGTSPSGCGIIVEGKESTGNLVEGNVLIRTGNCGIGVSNAARNTVRGNRILDTNLPGGRGNVGIYVASPSRAARRARARGEITCVDNVVADNVVSNRLPSGRSNDLYTPASCAGTRREANLTGARARALLVPEAEKLPPPPIPPLPYAPPR